MPEVPPSSRLHRCIRDLATLNALPAMCIGRTPNETLDIVVDALPTALSCELIYLTLQGGKVRATLRGVPVSGGELAMLTEALAAGPDASGVIAIERPERLWCLAVDVPIGAARGQLVAGKSSPLDLELGRVLVRCAANLVGSALESANVLEAAKRKDEFLAIRTTPTPGRPRRKIHRATPLRSRCLAKPAGAPGPYVIGHSQAVQHAKCLSDRFACARQRPAEVTAVAFTARTLHVSTARRCGSRSVGTPERMRSGRLPHSTRVSDTAAASRSIERQPRLRWQPLRPGRHLET